MTLAAALRERLRGHVVVVGVGNSWRADDGAGCRVAVRLRAGGRVDTIDAEEVPENFLGDIASTHPSTVVFVDAVDLRAPAGAVALVDREQLDRFALTTHRASLGLLMDLIVEATHADVFVLAIQPQCLDLLRQMTPEVAASADRVAALVEATLWWSSPMRKGRVEAPS